MAFLSPSWGLLGALALVVVLSLSGAAIQTARLGASQVAEKAVRADLEARIQEVADLQAANAKLARLNTQQSAQRAKAVQSVQDVLSANRKEQDEAPEPRPTVSDAQLNRLRRLTDAANASLRGASELP